MSVSPDTFNPHDVKLYSSRSDNSCMILFTSGQYGRFFSGDNTFLCYLKKISHILNAEKGPLENHHCKHYSEAALRGGWIRDPTFALTIPEFRNSDLLRHAHNPEQLLHSILSLANNSCRAAFFFT